MKCIAGFLGSTQILLRKKYLFPEVLVLSDVSPFRNLTFDAVPVVGYQNSQPDIPQLVTVNISS